MSQRSNTLKAAGLYTYISEHLAPEGSQSIADNVNIDERGVITPRRGFNDYGQSVDLDSTRIKQLMDYKGRIIRHYNDVLEFENASQTFTAFDGSYTETETGLRIKFQEMLGNLYFTTDDGIKKISAKSATEFTSDSGYIVNAGVTKAVDLRGKVSPDANGFLPPQSKVAYKVVFGYTDKNNILLLGSPSARYVLSNTSKDIVTNEQIEITFDDASAANYLGKYWLLDSLNNKYYIWYSDGTTSEPQDGDTLNRLGIEIIIDGTDDDQQVAAKTANTLSSQLTEFTIDLDFVNSKIILDSTEEGNLEDATEGTLSAEITLLVSLQGNVAEGTFANTQIEFIIPEGVTTDYFYQIYRTSYVEVSPGLTLEDIDPGEDCNLVYESAVVDPPGTTVTITDITPESFRDTGTPLYNNPISGEGILQANERPPIAKDLALFQNSMFYANTKTFHRSELTLVSIDDYVSGQTKFYVGNEDTLREYTFVGTQQSTVYTCDTVANTLETNANNSYILLNSANDEREYYIWFDKGTGVDPNIAGKVGIRVDISGSNVQPTDNVADYLSLALAEIDDFQVVQVGADVTVANANNGESVASDTPTSDPSTDIGAGWAIVVTLGTGEDSGTNSVLISNLASVSQSIDETARSLISIINQDTSSPVNAFYLSGPNDLPGKILFENKNLEDKPFYLAVSDANPLIGQEFSPELPVTDSPSGISINGTKSTITLNSHGLSDGDSIFLNFPNNDPVIVGTYPIEFIDANSFDIDVTTTTADATDAISFNLTVESNNSEIPNRLYYSKLRQPESVPIVNFIDVGEQDSAIERILSLRDNLFILKEDGIFILSGTTSFRVTALDTTAFITAPDSAVALNNQIIALTTQGITSINSSGASIISRSIEDKILNFANANFDFRLKTFAVGYESDRTYIMWCPTKVADTVATQAFRYNIFERTWTRWTIPATCGVIKKTEDIMYLGDGTRNYTLKERKNRDRTDHADRNFERFINPDALNGFCVRLSSIEDVEVGDAIVQEQYITVALYNRLLKKLDTDRGLDDTDYEDTLSASIGDDIQQKLEDLNLKLIADDDSGTITNHAFDTFVSNDQTLLDEFNLMMDELNSESCDTLLKTYRKPTKSVCYENLIIQVNRFDNEVVVLETPNFLQGSLQIYKGIKKSVVYNPQHYGDPSSLKQVRETTFMFDQNNFNTATAYFASDLSPSFWKVPVSGNGSGYWDGQKFGDRTLYWGGNGSDKPVRVIVPRSKQRCRALTFRLDHVNARESFRLIGITAVVRTVSSRAYK